MNVICPLCYWVPSAKTGTRNGIQKLASHLKAYHRVVERPAKGKRMGG